MPLEPSIGDTDLHSSVTFLARTHTDLWTVVVFCSAPYTSFTCPSSAHFCYSKSLPSNALFSQTATITSTVTWQSVSSTKQISAYVDFSQTKSLSSFVTFTGEATQFQSFVNFMQAATLPSSAIFGYAGTDDLPCIVNFGIFQTDIYNYVTFWQFGLLNFPLQMNITNYVSPKIVNFGDDFKFLLELDIGGGAFAFDLISMVNFYVPIPEMDLPSNVQFEQKTFHIFQLNVNINNVFSGVNNIQILTALNPSDPVGGIKDTLNTGDLDYITLPVTTDQFGYFEVTNLLPGNYLLYPYYPGLTFAPNYIDVTITNSNLTIYFYALGDLSIIQDSTGTNPPFPIPSGSSCYINQGSGTSGSFSIDGYVLPYNIIQQQPNMFVVATDETSAANFRETLGNG